jgi:hypothetical protein
MISKGKEVGEWIGERKELMATCLLGNEEGAP